MTPSRSRTYFYDMIALWGQVPKALKCHENHKGCSLVGDFNSKLFGYWPLKFFFGTESFEKCWTEWKGNATAPLRREWGLAIDGFRNELRKRGNCGVQDEPSVVLVSAAQVAFQVWK